MKIPVINMRKARIFVRRKFRAGGTGNLPVAVGYQPAVSAMLNSQFQTLPASLLLESPA
jgi:hypothetical protein